MAVGRWSLAEGRIGAWLKEKGPRWQATSVACHLVTKAEPNHREKHCRPKVYLFISLFSKVVGYYPIR
jgi:hypothetical protein